MRLLLIILLLSWAIFFALPPLCAQSVSLKHHPAAYLNTYKFSDKDHVFSYNYSPVYTGPSGRRYLVPYAMQGIQILGNNWSRKLLQLDSLPRGSICFYEPDAQTASEAVTAWAASLRYVFMLKGDSVHHIYPLPLSTGAKYQYIYAASNGFYFIGKPDSGRVDALFFSFETQTFDAPFSWDFPHSFQHIALVNTPSDKAVIHAAGPDSFVFYRIVQPGHQLQRTAAFSTKQGGLSYLRSADLFVTAQPQKEPNKLQHTLWRNGQPVRSFTSTNVPFSAGRYLPQRLPDNTFQILDCQAHDTAEQFQMVLARDGIQNTSEDPMLGAYYISTPNKPLRVFPWIKQYPLLYGGTNSAATFSLTQDSAGHIWAGSYNGALSRIVGDTVVPFPFPVGRIINGGQWLNGRMYLIEEGDEGLAAFTPYSRKPALSKGTTAFYTFLSRDHHFYLGTYNNRGLWRTTPSQLASARPQWKKIGPEQGIRLGNILTLTEDTLGRIWCGHPKTGIAVYDPKTGQGQTWRKDEAESNVTAMASLTDSKGTVWLGGPGALWYYNDYKQPASPQNCRLITHPLLPPDKPITAFTIWQKDWLIIAAYDRVLLLDLKTFYWTGAVNMRYLNPQEAAFTSFTEQNTLFTSHTDNTVWLSTSDNVYQWDVTRWLALPQFQTTARVTLHAKGTDRQLLDSQSVCQLAPGLRTFELHVDLTSPDALPRYLRTALVQRGDSTQWEEASLQSVFTFPNANAGHYQFLIEIFEMDGTVQRLSFALHLKPHFWQTIWFWTLITAIILGFAFAIIFYNLKARTKKAELEALRSEQQKKLADLRLLTMANQFRPHFILNALNSIGSRLNNDARTEQVLASLGNSINIIFNNARRQGALHAFAEEWKLVLEVIQIHRLMYLPTLQTTLPDANELKKLSGMRVPLGLLQIPVENALLHGLGNVQNGTLALHMGILERKEAFEIVITDTGVGRQAAGQMSNATGHGTGIKNLEAMLKILAANGADHIELKYEDGIYTDDNNKNSKFGTRVLVIIPKTFVYG